MTNPKVVYSIDDLRLAINRVFDEKLFKGDLVRRVSEEFEKKGLDSRVFQLLMNDQINISNLKDYELIAISKVLYNELKSETLNPKKYFGDNLLVNYENKIKIEEKIDFIELKNFIKIDDFNFRGQIDYKDIYTHLNYNNFFYDHEAQRSPKYRTVGSKSGKGKKLRVENLNIQAVEQIADSILEGKFEDSEIILNCEMIQGKKQRFKFINKYENILGDIVIKPDYDIESKTTTWVSITDGFHRCKGIVLAVSKHLEQTGKMLEGSIGVRLVRADKDRAKRIVHQTFMRASDEPEWINALVDDDYSKFVDLVLKASKRLTVENTVEEAENNDKLTSKSLLIDTVRKMKIAVNDESEAYFKSIDIAKNFDLIFDISNKLGIKMTPYKAIAYFYLAYKMIGNNLDFMDILNKLEDNKQFINMAKKIDNLNKMINVIDEVIISE